MCAVTISDDEKWLGNLSGRSDDISSAEDDKQVQVLRAVITQQYHSDMAEMGEPDAQQLNRLLERCRDEGLLENKKRWWGQAYWVPELSAVAMICLLVIVGVNVIGNQKETAPEVVYRGGSTTHLLELEKRVPSPAKAAAKLQHDFEAAGASVLIYQQDADWHVKIDLDVPYSKAVFQLLNKYEIPSDEDKQLRVVFKPVKAHP